MFVRISLDRTSEVEFEILTRCGLLVRKEKIHRVMVELRSISISFFNIKCGWMVLKALEMTRNSCRTYDFGFSKCVLMMKQCQYGIFGASVRGVCELHWVLLEAGSFKKSTIRDKKKITTATKNNNKRKETKA